MTELYDQFDKSLYKLEPTVPQATENSMELAPEQVGSGTSVSTQKQAMGSTFVGKTGFTNNEAGYILGIDKGVAKFYIGDATNYLNWTGTSLVIAGSLTVSSGTIGGFSISATAITATNLILDSSGQRISLGSANDIVILDADDGTYRLWIGNATAASAPFSVTKAGAVTASNITITGGSVGSSVVVAIGALNIAARGWTQTSVFSVTDADTVAWASGTFTSADGTAYSISGGNTGNMAAATYVYLDTAVSTTAYQTTTTAANAVGAGKVLVAKAQNGTGEATFQVFGGIGGQNIDAASIVANSITANELSTSITYAGQIIIDVGGNIRSGQTAFNTGTGWFIGNDSGTAKLSIGNPSTRYLTWDGSNLTINGYVQTNIGAFGGDGSDGALAVSSGTTTIDLNNEAVVVLNYTSVSITGTGKVAFSNPHAGGTIVIIKSQGAVVLTSSTSPCLDLQGVGAVAGSGGAAETDGSNGTNVNDIIGGDSSRGALGQQGSSSAATGGATYTSKAFYMVNIRRLYRKFIAITAGSGAGGGGGGGAGGGGAAGAGGNGGRGGGGLIIECAGALNFTGTISVAGANGSVGANASSNAGGGGGGGGGAGGMAIVLYNTLTSAAGTITVSGGNGGNGGNGSTGASTGGAGGSGAGQYNGAGGASGGGGASTNNGANGSSGSVSETSGAGAGTGGTGGTVGTTSGGGGGGGGGTGGEYLIAQNIMFG